MKHEHPNCPGCGRSDAVGNIWHHPNGHDYFTCHGLNRDGHPGVSFHFDAETLAPLRVRDRHEAPLLTLISGGEPSSFRGYPAEFLHARCLVSAVSAKHIDRCMPLHPELGVWARQRESDGEIISILPVMNGPEFVGIQFRAFSRKTGDGASDGDHIRMHGEADAIYIPVIAGVRPSAVVVHEGPWGAIAANHDACGYGNSEVISIATLSANVRPETIRITLDLLFPGVPRFSLFDQDPAGIRARARAQHVLKPISITGAGPGKDYRDLDQDFRFEQLCESVRKELKLLQDQPQSLIIPNAELDACLCKLPMTEYGLADRFVERHGKLCRYIDDWKQWVVFDGACWIRSNTKAEFMAQDVIKRLEYEAHHLKEHND